jgi:undecaprenyl diphosphate synthase
MHIGIIMDGNGRWATNQNLPRLAGHSAGIDAVLRLVRACPTVGVDAVTLFAFAIANWKRDKEEVDGLWTLFHHFFVQHVQELKDADVRIKVIGNRAGLPKEILADVEKTEADSRENKGFLLQIALNYDGVEEVARMLQKAIETKIEVREIDSEYIKNNLDTQSSNDPDIIIRTGMPAMSNGLSTWRSSAFLPLQSVQSVCVSTETLWPDFSIEHLKEIITYVNLDSRLFGGQRR